MRLSEMDVECEYCNKSFLTEGRCYQHKEDSHPELIQSLGTDCDICGRSFCFHSSLLHHKESGYHERIHLKNAANPNKTIPCPLCIKKFVSLESMEHHKNSTTKHGKIGATGYTQQSPRVDSYESLLSRQLEHSLVMKTTPAASSRSFNTMFDEKMTSSELNKMIDDNLQPTEEFNREVNRDMDFLASYLKNQSGLEGVAEIVKGGSLAKGTGIKGKADLDVVLYLNTYSDMDDFRCKLKDTLDDLRAKVKNWMPNNGKYRVKIDGMTKHAVKLKIRRNLSDEYVDVDLLPAMDVLKNKGKHATYREMNGTKKKERGYYSPALAPLQIEFVQSNATSPSVKNLIRLVKHWRKTQFKERRDPKDPKLPVSYVFELLTIHAWQQAGRPLSFDTRKAFKSVLSQLRDNDEIDVEWNDNYESTDYSNAKEKQDGSPFILDPANPFNNICEEFKGSWEEVSEEAKKTMERKLLRDVEEDKENWQ